MQDIYLKTNSREWWSRDQHAVLPTQTSEVQFILQQDYIQLHMIYLLLLTYDICDIHITTGLYMIIYDFYNTNTFS